MSLPVLILSGVAALVILAGVVLVVMGRGGELARFEADYPPVDLPADRPVTGTDVGRLRLPLALWGYHVRAVDEALHRVGAALAERDRRIAVLEGAIVDLGGVSALRVAHDAGGGWRPEPRPHPMALDDVEEHAYAYSQPVNAPSQPGHVYGQSDQDLYRSDDVYGQSEHAHDQPGQASDQAEHAPDRSEHASGWPEDHDPDDAGVAALASLADTPTAEPERSEPERFEPEWPEPQRPEPERPDADRSEAGEPPAAEPDTEPRAEGHRER